MTLFGLAAVALISLISAVAFMRAWDEHLLSLEPDDQGRGRLWGRSLQRRIESEIDAVLDGNPRETRLLWAELIPPRVTSILQEEASNDDDVVEVVLLKDEKVVAGSGEGAWAGDPGAGLHPRGTFSVVVRPEAGKTRVYVRGPVLARAPVRDTYTFSGVLELPSFTVVTERGRTFALALVIGNLVMLYVLFVAVFLIGRREMRLEFSSKEKEIRLKAIASVAEGIAHEVRNPLNAISLNVQYLEKLKDRAGKEPQPEDYQRVHVELGKIRKVIDNFVNFARLRELELTEWDMNDAVEEARKAVEPALEDHEVLFTTNSAGDTRLDGDRPKVERVLNAVFSNAVDAVRGRDERTVSVEVEGHRGGVRVVVHDSGETPTEDVLRNMFDPYFTTRAAAMGLGLTLAKTVVEAHGGTIKARVPEAGGCVVELAFPRRF